MEHPVKDSLIKRSHVTTAIGIVIGTISVLAWLNTSYVSAGDFNKFKQSTGASLQRNDLNNRKSQLELRNKMLDDKLFELTTAEKATKNSKALNDRYVREMEGNQKTIEGIQDKLNRIKDED